jgi:hypothetical protein
MDDTVTVTVTGRNRNLGYAWTSQPVRRRTASGGDYLALPAPPAPHNTGGPRTLREARAHAQRVNRGNDWTEAVFVGGRRVVAVDGIALASHDLVDWFLNAIRQGSPVELTLASADDEQEG